MRYGEFFQSLEQKIYAFYDRQKNVGIVDDIDALFDGSWQLEQTGVEFLLADEVEIGFLRKFLVVASEWDDYPYNANTPARFEYMDDLGDDDVRKLAKRVLRARKGSGYAGRLVELCEPDDLPDVIVEALEMISEALPDNLGLDEDEDVSEDEDGTDSPEEV